MSKLPRRQCFPWLPFVCLTSLALLCSDALRDQTSVLALSSPPQEEIYAQLEPNLDFNPNLWMNQANVLYQRGQVNSALKLWHRSAQYFKDSGQSLKYGLALNNVALAHQQLGEWSEAKHVLEAASSAIRSISRPTSAVSHSQDAELVLAQVLALQGNGFLASGQLEDSLAVLKEAESLFHQANRSHTVIQIQIRQAHILRKLGRLKQAQTQLEELTKALRTESDSELKALATLSYGNVLHHKGDFSLAGEILQESLNISKALDSPSNISAALLSLGNLARTRQQYPNAIAFYQQAIEQFPNSMTALKAWTNQLSLWSETKQWQLVEANWLRVHTRLNKLPPNRDSVAAWLLWGDSLIEYQKSVPDPETRAILAQGLSTAIGQADILQNPRLKSYAVGMLGAVYQANQQWQEAESLTQQALQSAQFLNAPEQLYRWQWQSGQIFEGQGNFKAAIAAYTSSINTLKTLRNDLVALNPEFQASFRDKIEPIYRQLVDLLLSGGDDTQKNQQTLETALEIIDSLRLLELEYFLGCDLTSSIIVDQIISDVDPTAAFIFPILLDNRVEIIVKLPGETLKHKAYPVSRSEVEETLVTLQKNLSISSATDDVKIHSQKLYNWLIGPIRKELDIAQKSGQLKTLVFILEPSIQNIPMGTLFNEGTYLIEDFSVAVVPNRQLLDPRPRKKRLDVLTAGISEPQEVDGISFSELPYVVEELQQIQNISDKQSSSLINQAFTKNALRDNVHDERSRVVHIATHGEFSANPNQTYLLAWGQKIKVQNFNELFQIAPFRNAGTQPVVELLVLSACQTAQGDRRSALGLAGAAVRSNVRSTIATLWQVKDQSTAKFMAQFYRELKKGETLADALRNTQVSFIKDPDLRRPHYWSSFILIGNWR